MPNAYMTSWRVKRREAIVDVAYSGPFHLNASKTVRQALQ